MVSNGSPLMFILSLLILASCQNAVDSQRPEGSSDWLVPLSEVFDGGPGKDGIPALTNPTFVPAHDANYLSEGDLVIGVKVGEEVRAYPHPILDWHEIINDDINGTLLAITYCPLTGSGIGWKRTINGQTTTFGVSGLLYNTNLIPYDRATNSNWSQMRLQCVNGPLKGDFIETSPVLETTWKTWKEMYPQTKVVSTSTGFSRPYGVSPYGDYRTNDRSLLFPISNEDGRLPRKERVHGVIIGQKTKVYRVNSFSDNIQTINDNINNVPVVAVGSRSKNFVITYERGFSDGKILSFKPVQNGLPVVMVDDEGTTWDVWGKGISGLRAGTQLKATRSYIAYWFAWGAFFPGAEIQSP